MEVDQSLPKHVLDELRSCLKSLRSEDVIPLSLHVCEHQIPTKIARSKSDRFLVNIYEKPRNLNMKKRRRSLVGLNLTKSVIQFTKNKQWTVCDKNQAGCKNTESKEVNMDQFNVECLKLKEASNILQYLNRHSLHGNWFERLLAEKVLLESGKAVSLINERIRENYVGLKDEKIRIGKVSLSNFKFYLNKYVPKPKETEFFVLVLSSETQVKASKIVRPHNGDVVFTEKFTFPINKNFNIKLQLHSILMKEQPKLGSLSLIKSLLCKTSEKQQLSRLQYKNLNTCDFEEIRVLETSFKLCGETEVLPSNLRNKAWELNVAENSQLTEFVTFSVEVEGFKIEYKQSGFLTLGTTTVNDAILWNRKWCILDGHILKVYNSPSEEDVFSPGLKVDFLNCSQSSIGPAPTTLCNRKRSFMIQTFENEEERTYFFMADNSEELKKWISDLNLILDLIKFKNFYKL